MENFIKINLRGWVRVAPLVCAVFCALASSAAQAAAGANPDPFLVEILKGDVLEKKPGVPKDGKAPTSRLNSARLQKEVPLQTPLAQAKSTMERHGFTCWAGLSDGRGEYMQCDTYQVKNQRSAERIIVKIYYRMNRVVDFEVTVEHNVRPPMHHWWSRS
jgi:hypothetical protein